MPGVTTILGDGLPKPALITWAGRATAAYAVDNWDDLAGLPVSERLRRLEAGRYETRDAAAARGTEVHALAEQLLAGQRVVIPDGLEGYVSSCVDFLDSFAVRPVHVEAVVFSETRHHVGTCDLVADVLLPDMREYGHIRRDADGFCRGLFDWKTSRSGIFGDAALQLAAYRHSEHLMTGDGDVIDMPEVDICAAIHLRPDGYSCVPLECDDRTYRSFLHIAEVARVTQDLRSLVGEPLIPPTAGTYRLTRDEGEA